LRASADCGMRQGRRRRGLVPFYTVFEAIEWPNNYACGCGVSVSFHINETKRNEMMAALLFMVYSTTHYV
jgi:hypothetical protein